MEKYQNKYRIPSTRLQGYDYGSNGFYFVTICTKKRFHYFGNIVETHYCASNNTKPPTKETHHSPSHNTKPPTKETHHSPSHNTNEPTEETHNSPSHNTNEPTEETHNCASNNTNESTKETHNGASLQPTPIGQTVIDYWSEIPKHYPFVELFEFVVMPNHIHGILCFNKIGKTDWQPNQFGVQSQNLGAVIRAFKSSVKRYANQNKIEFEWQSSYHDRIIRNERALNAIRQYIIDNPLNWKNDALNWKNDTLNRENDALNWKNDTLNVRNVETGNCPPLRQIIEHETKNLF